MSGYMVSMTVRGDGFEEVTYLEPETGEDLIARVGKLVTEELRFAVDGYPLNISISVTGAEASGGGN